MSSCLASSRRPKTLHHKILAFYRLPSRPYLKRVIILMGDFCVLYVRSSCTCAELLNTGPGASGSSSPQARTPRRLRRTPSPFGSGRQLPELTNSRGAHFQSLPRELVRLEALLRLFFSRRTSPSTRFLVQVRGAVTPHSRATTFETWHTSLSIHITWALW